MTIEEAMTARHTVRSFLDRPLAEETAALLEERVRENNERHGLSIRLVRDDTKAFGPLLRALFAKGVRNYFVLAGADKEKLGYASADLMLYAQMLGLNTWWVGGTYNRRAVAAKDEPVIGIVAVGYGKEQGHPHSSRTVAEGSTYEGEMPEWFDRGVKAALLAPTAMNRQAFYLSGRGNRVSARYAKGFLSEADLGIVKYHFEIGAGRDSFEWTEQGSV